MVNHIGLTVTIEAKSMTVKESTYSGGQMVNPIMVVRGSCLFRRYHSALFYSNENKSRPGQRVAIPLPVKRLNTSDLYPRIFKTHSNTERLRAGYSCACAFPIFCVVFIEFRFINSTVSGALSSSKNQLSLSILHTFVV